MFVIHGCLAFSLSPPRGEGAASTIPPMLDLVRVVRFCLTGLPDEDCAPCLNPYAAWPAMRGLSRYYELAAHCRGEAEPKTGYFLDIRIIDEAVRRGALPILRRAVSQSAAQAAQEPMGALMAELFAAVQAPLGGVLWKLEFRLTPTFVLSIASLDSAMPTFEVRQQYDFAAAHRLAVPGLSDAENAGIFGKCSNPAGHGHNYRVEVCASAEIAPDGHTALTRDPVAMDAWVDGALIARLDHKHLNLDVPEFREKNPSVEHIAQLAWKWLNESAPAGCKLAEVSVWETEKTRCVVRSADALVRNGAKRQILG